MKKYFLGGLAILLVGIAIFAIVNKARIERAATVGNLFSGALKLRHLNRVMLSADGKAIGEERLLTALNERIRALIQGPEGWLYFSTDSGKIYVIKPAAKE